MASASADEWAAWVGEFYDAHALLVMQTLQLDDDAAIWYCTNQATCLLAEGLTVLEKWLTEDYAADLAALALEDAA